MRKIILGLLFSFLFGYVSSQPANNLCSGAQSLGTLPAPKACPNGVGNTTTVSGTTINATGENPYTSLLNCQTGGNEPGPALDVWYSFVASGNQVTIKITPGAAPFLPNPAVTLWTGTCGSLVGYNCANNGTAAGNLTVTFAPLTPGQTYYIQVSGMTATASGNFNLAVNASNDCSACLQNSSLTVTPLPINGTYAPGTTVNFCFTITKYTQVSSNWLDAVIPTFGCGWDLTTLTTTSPSSVSGDGPWSWFSTPWTSVANGNNWGPGFGFVNTTDQPGSTNPGQTYGDYC